MPAMDEAATDHKRPPWRRTVAVQAALCLALYAAFSLGEPQLVPQGGGGVDALGRGARGGGVAFLSVAGGARAPAQQARLLRQMETIAKFYEVKFVLDIAQLGEDDPLWQNGSLYFQDLNIPWYSTTSLRGRKVDNFLRKVNMSYDLVVDIIGLDTGPLQEPVHDGKISTSYREQTKWLEQSLALTRGNWNAYLSTGGFCGSLHRNSSILYIRNPSPVNQTNVDGFFLHRVSNLEMESLLINVEGKVVQRSVIHQHGAGAI
ncbi:hypothetical protein ACP70R_041726 [Stipagrostis hirtigluma subsp. patula]